MKRQKSKFVAGLVAALVIAVAGCEPNVYVKVNNRYPFPVHLAAHFNDPVDNKPVVVDIGTVAANSSASLNGGMKGGYFEGAVITNAKGKKLGVVDINASSNRWPDEITLSPTPSKH